MSTQQNEGKVLTDKKVEFKQSSFRLVFNHETKQGYLAVTHYFFGTATHLEPVLEYSDLVKLKNMLDLTLDLTDSLEQEKLAAAFMKMQAEQPVPWYRKVTQYLTGKKYSNTLSN